MCGRDEKKLLFSRRISLEISFSANRRSDKINTVRGNQREGCSCQKKRRGEVRKKYGKHRRNRFSGFHRTEFCTVRSLGFFLKKTEESSRCAEDRSQIRQRSPGRCGTGGVSMFSQHCEGYPESDVLDELSPLICGACADSVLDRYRDVSPVLYRAGADV